MNETNFSPPIIHTPLELIMSRGDGSLFQFVICSKLLTVYTYSSYKFPNVKKNVFDEIYHE